MVKRPKGFFGKKEQELLSFIKKKINKKLVSLNNFSNMTKVNKKKARDKRCLILIIKKNYFHLIFIEEI